MITDTPSLLSARVARAGAVPIHGFILLALSLGAAGLAGAGIALWLGREGVAGPPLLAASVAAAITIGLALAGAL
ncbi:MAG: hypothetical protein KGO05_15000, partial [Chloroflexota bacterium]|nr:hypothetical protein [Chloroflexota bacterium]